VDVESLRAQFRAEIAPQFPAPPGAPDLAQARGLLIAALRELYEEAGVLLACDASGAPLSEPQLAPSRKRLHEARSPVQRGELAFTDLLEEIGAYADARTLALFSHWITPPSFSRRYNAHFFVAEALPGQAAAADAFETHDGVWIAPRTALERCSQGDFRMVYPTIKHVERLAEFNDTAALVEFARTKPIYSIMPDVPAEREFSIPPDLEYAW
jgi:8-oxo-dGTP pyrophosphatase MutT (NUDIX family)